MQRRRAPRSLILGSLFACVAALAAAPSAYAQQSKFSDLICPNATDPVREYEMARRMQPPAIDHLIGTAKKAIAAYNQCAATKLTEGEASTGLPNQSTQYSNDSGVEREHYANLRSAQYYLTIGKLHRLLERFDLARISFAAGLELVKNTVDWQASGQVSFRSNNTNLGSGSVHKPGTTYSSYRNDAIALRDNLLAELARLPKLEDGVASPNPR
jgi:hypothetical protein